jgi:hypothetical protein
VEMRAVVEHDIKHLLRTLEAQLDWPVIGAEARGQAQPPGAGGLSRAFSSSDSVRASSASMIGMPSRTG